MDQETLNAWLAYVRDLTAWLAQNSGGGVHTDGGPISAPPLPPVKP